MLVRWRHHRTYNFARADVSQLRSGEPPDIAKFCLACATPLAEAPRLQAEERKTVTVLFCDLVGFTASSDLADPEDVRARIRPYHARLRQEIEGYGGTVEKF